MSVPFRRALEAQVPSLPTSFKEGKETDDCCSPLTFRKSMSFPDLTAMEAAINEGLSSLNQIPVPPIPPPLPLMFEPPALQKTFPVKTPEKERKMKPLPTSKPQLTVAPSELHYAKQHLKKVTMGEGGKRGPLNLKAKLPSAYVTPMVNYGRRMSDGAVKTEGLLKKMHKNLSQDIPTTFDFHSQNLHDNNHNNNNNDDEEAEYADAFDILAMKINEPWFFGNADRISEEKLMSTIGLDGTFLVRKSRGKNHSQPFTLTVLYDKHLFRLKIRYLPCGDYALGEKKAEEIKFPSVQALVSHYQKVPLILMGVGGGRTLLKHIPSSI